MKVQLPSYKTEVTGLRNQLADMLPAASLDVFNADADQLALNHQNPLKVQPGDVAPLFTLSNATGNSISLAHLLKSGPVVLAFYRGTWCPYCNLQLNIYQRVLDRIRAAGASLVAISPQTPDESLNIAEKNALQFEVLSDPGNKVARQYISIFTNTDAAVAEMAKLGINFDAFYSDKSHELPVTGVFIIDSMGIIRFAKADGDYRVRTDAADILDVLDQLNA